MSKRIQLTLTFDEDLEAVLKKDHPQMDDFRILNKSLDARGSNRGKKPKFIYDVEIISLGESFSGQRETFVNLGPIKQPPIIVGAGPAGLFCALRFAEYGIPTVLIERGDRAHRRMLSIAKFWRYGEFNVENNVCYGEGGAGLFSDGKLITRIKSPYVQYVMNKLVEFGAPPETAYLSNPHLGSNKIRQLINLLSDFLMSRGHQLKFNTRVDRLLVEDHQVKGVQLNNGEKIFSEHVILATGHSAKEMYYHLKDLNVPMKGKDFAVGVRIEHPREVIDSIQHGAFASSPILGAARYRLSYEDETSKKGTYSFCMCPGGYVLSSGTDSDGIVVNGMSNYARNSRWSNAALVVATTTGVDFRSEDILAGLEFQRKIETKAYQVSKSLASGRELPSMTVYDFVSGKLSAQDLPKSSTPSGTVKANIRDILPNFVTNHLENALIKFDQVMKGFVSEKALLLAPETRTSAPVTILRDKFTLESTGLKGLYPCGEGAGHAGGITSAAVDGVRIAMSIIEKEKGFRP